MVFVFDFSNAALDIRFDVRENGLKGLFSFNDRLRGVGQGANRIGEPLRNLLADIRHSVDAIRKIRERRLDFLEPVSQTTTNVRQNIAQTHGGLFEAGFVTICGHGNVRIAHAIVVLRQLLAECNHRIRELLHRVFSKVFGTGDAIGETLVDVDAELFKELGRGVNVSLSSELVNDSFCKATNGFLGIFDALIDTVN